MQSHEFPILASNTRSSVLDMGGESGAYFVDLYLPDVGSGAAEWDTADLTFEYTIDGVNFNNVPGMTVADNEAGYKGRFLVWGNKLSYTQANASGAASTLRPVVIYKAASMTEIKSSFTSLTQGVLSGDTGNEAFTFGRAPDMLLLDVEAGTHDSVSMVIQGSVGGTNWFDLDGTRSTNVGQYRTFSNPGGLTRFRIEWTGGGLSMATGRITVIGLTNADAPGIKKDANVMPAAYNAMIDLGTPAGDFTMVTQTATWDSADVTIQNNNLATIVTQANLLGAEVARMRDALLANGLIPTT